METKTWAVGLAAFCALLGSSGQLLFKLGSSSVMLSLSSWITNLKVIGGMTLYGVSAILFVIALKYGNLSVLYPVIATSYVWVAVLSNQVLGEPMSLLKWGGLALILLGITLIVRS
jgi:multidrug transporter EmrE-like cation transporter